MWPHHEPAAVPVAPPALLALADGTVFRGTSAGAAGLASGEVVFNTAITGYQEILTDPSYCRQIVTLTHPHIGNTGTNREDLESGKVFAAGLVVRDLSAAVSSWRADGNLSDFLVSEKVVAIAGIDTRRLTRILREKGAQNGAVLAGSDDAARALEAARAFPGLAGMDLAKVVTTAKPYEWSEGRWRAGGGFGKGADLRFHVVAYDYGIKRNILRMLVDRDDVKAQVGALAESLDRKSTRLNSSHQIISYAVFCLKKKKKYLEIHGGHLSYLILGCLHFLHKS